MDFRHKIRHDKKKGKGKTRILKLIGLSGILLSGLIIAGDTLDAQNGNKSAGSPTLFPQKNPEGARGAGEKKKADNHEANAGRGGAVDGKFVSGGGRGESRLEFISLGEVVAVQKNKGAIRITALDRGVLRRKSAGQIKKHFMGKRRILTILDRQGRKAGTFQSTRVEVEWGLRPGRLKAITLYGFFKLKDPGNLRYLAVGYRAGFYNPRRVYTTPDYHRPGRRVLKQIRHVVDRKLMVYIPESFLAYGQGDRPELDNYNPYFFQRDPGTVRRLRPFYIDKYEVTNHEYWTFCRKAGHPLPAAWRARSGKYPSALRDHPVTVASYQDARAYARWTNKRLPTELEWELAARGSLNQMKSGSGPISIAGNLRIYPMGNDFDADRCNTLESGRGRTISVYQSRDMSPFGVFGLCGNAREWTSSWYNPYPGSRFGQARDFSGRQFKVIRGGSYAQDKSYARSDARDYGGFPSLYEDRSAGFRLVSSVR